MIKRLILDMPKYIFRILSLGSSKGEHVTRYFIYKHFSATFKEQRNIDDRVLSISGSESLCRILGYNDSSIIDASYPEFNILSLPFEDSYFDAVWLF